MEAIWSGSLTKMSVKATDPVTYHLTDGYHEVSERAEDVHLNPLIGARMALRYTGHIQCAACGRKSKKTFGPGYCFPCFRSRPEADICIVKPEKCHYFEADNPCRDDEFAQSHCFQPHVLYVSVTSGVKVGITRKVNVPTRWIDQGAVHAIPLAQLPSRREVGLVEVELAKAFADKTHWATMLRTKEPDVDLEGTTEAVLARLESMKVRGVLPEGERQQHSFRYPVESLPDKVKSLNLDKTPDVEGTLLGIKGQYLIFDTGVINLRKYTGYRVEVFSDAAA